MTDPDAVQHEQPPPQPPRPVQEPVPVGSTPQSQVEADEEYARQLAQHYENVGAYEARTSNRSGPQSRSRQQTGLTSGDDDREHSFLDDDLPVIRENLRKGFVETQNKFNTWFTNVKKRIDEEWNEEPEGSQQQQGGRNAFMGRPSRDGANTGRRSGDYDRYDADPELLSDDFAGMKFNNDGSKLTLHTSARYGPQILTTTTTQPQQTTDQSPTPISSSLPHRQLHRNQVIAKSPSAKAPTTSTPTTHRPSCPPRITHQEVVPRRVNGSPYLRWTRTPSPTTTPSASATARTKRTIMVARKATRSRWRTRNG